MKNTIKIFTSSVLVYFVIAACSGVDSYQKSENQFVPPNAIDAGSNENSNKQQTIVTPNNTDNTDNTIIDSGTTTTAADNNSVEDGGFIDNIINPIPDSQAQNVEPAPITIIEETISCSKAVPVLYRTYKDSNGNIVYKQYHLIVEKTYKNKSLYELSKIAVILVVKSLSETHLNQGYSNLGYNYQDGAKYYKPNVTGMYDTIVIFCGQRIEYYTNNTVTDIKDNIAYDSVKLIYEQ